MPKNALKWRLRCFVLNGKVLCPEWEDTCPEWEGACPEWVGGSDEWEGTCFNYLSIPYS